MEYRWIENIEEFRDIANEWDEVLIASGNYNPFLLSDFIITWWEHFHDNLHLRILAIYNDDKLLGGLPLYVKRLGFGYCGIRILYYIGGTAANYTEPFYVSSGAKFLPLFKEALENKTDWDVVYLTDVRSGSKLITEYYNETSDRRFLCYIIQDHMNWAIDLSDGVEKYLSTISGKLRRDLRAKRKHLTRNFGKLVLKEIKDKEQVKEYFDLYTRFSLNAFAARGKKSSFEDRKYTDFFREFLVLMNQRQRLDAHVLLAGDETLAVSFGYRFGKGFNWVLTGFNYEYKYFRPGYILIEELIKEICNRGETYYNWYGYERFYKTQWCNKQIPLYRFFLIRRTLKGICYSMLRNIEGALRSNKRAVELVQKLRKVLNER